MGSSWTSYASGCKSRLSAIARSCFLRRQHWLRKYQEAKRAEKEVRESLVNAEARCLELQQKNQDLCRQVAELQAESAKPRPIQLPLGDVPPGQQYAANRIALSVNLARQLGIRGSVHAQKIF
jgi:hypothetical protein